MALTFLRGDRKFAKPSVQLAVWLHTNADQTKLIHDTHDPECAYVLGQPGSYVTHDDAVKYGLIDEAGKPLTSYTFPGVEESDTDEPKETEPAVSQPEGKKVELTSTKDVEGESDPDEVEADDDESKGDHVAEEVKKKELEATVTEQKTPKAKVIEPNKTKKIG